MAAEFRQFIDHSAAQGYNGVVVPGFLEYVTFARVGDGHAVYPAGDPHVARAQAMVREFAPVFRYAADMGMRVYFMTDMLALSGPLDAYLKTQRDPWAVYQSGLRELFREHAVRVRADGPHRRGRLGLPRARLGLLLAHRRHHAGPGAGDAQGVPRRGRRGRPRRHLPHLDGRRRRGR
nr:hypothetical protein GCM10020092_073600 [Actinoplanes digitatis]